MRVHLATALVGLGTATLAFAPLGANLQRGPTFNGDVARIFYAKCVNCHRPGEAAPMSLLTYQEARPWARAIRSEVSRRSMPPWFADPTFSRPLANDNSLTPSEIATVVAWADGGAAEGEGAAPQPPSFVAGWRSFNGRPPDAVVETPMPFDVPAEGIVPVFTVWSPNPFNEDKFIEAVELRPGSIAAVHHSDVTARALPAGTTLRRGRAWRDGPVVSFMPVYPGGDSVAERLAGSAGVESVFAPRDDSRLLFYVPGGGFQRFPPGAVKRISAGNVLAWGLHYTPTGRPESDRHRLGLWFARAPHTHEVITKRIGEAHIIDGREFVAEGPEAFAPIPPFANDWRITAITPFQDDVTVYSAWPHMHLRGKDMTFIATYPDGREEVLLHVPKYDFRWQLQYEFVEPVRLPAGSTIKAIGHYDNSARNPSNPAPEKPVYWSEQSADEMFNGWLEMSVDRHVIAHRAVYTLATPINRRVSVSLGSGPAGTVLVRDARGQVVTTGTIGAAPSFLEPWTFTPGQTITTAPSGSESGTVTLTMYDVPPDVNRELEVGGPAVAVTTSQPGQNGMLTFEGAASQSVSVHVIGNRMGAVTLTVSLLDRTSVLGTTTSAQGSFNLADLTLPASGRYVIDVDPVGAAVGTLNVAVTSRRDREKSD